MYGRATVVQPKIEAALRRTRARVDVVYNRPFDPAYQAILDRAVALGYTLPSGAQQVKQNTFLERLRLTGIWPLMDVLYVFATDGSKEFTTLNWKAPTLHQATMVNSPTFTINQGFNGNGTTSYLNTNFNPATSSVQATQNSNSFAIGINTNPAQADVAVGFARNAGVFNQFFTRSSFAPGSAISRVNQTSTPNVTFVNSTRIGNYIGWRSSASLIRFFKNGAEQTLTGLHTGTTLTNAVFFLGGENNGGALQSPSTERFTHFAWGNFGALQAAFNTEWVNYFTSL